MISSKMKNTNISVQYIKGVGPARAAILKKIGIKTINDLLTHFPFRYEDRRKIKCVRDMEDNEEGSICAVVTKHKLIPVRRRGKMLLKIILEDGTGSAEMICFNQKYLLESLPIGTQLIVHGKFSRIGRFLQLTNFEYEKLSGTDEDLIHTKRIVPIYPSTDGLNQRFLRTLIKRVLDEYMPYFEEMLTQSIISEYSLDGYSKAIINVHFPEGFPEQETARRRMVFEEFFFWEIGMALKKQKVKQLCKKRKYEIKKTLLSKFRVNLGFDFTTAQKRAINEIFNDMMSPSPMNRLLQGDVGSGKTVVALASLLLAAENKFQSVLMAPTEILAEQHRLTVERMIGGLGLTIELLTSRQKPAAKKEALERIKNGSSNIIIGTHALIEENVVFKNLSLVVIDEQHKFGVIQRSTMREKGMNPDVLVMTATPIPRTLAMTVYGDLDISVIDELPPGRKAVVTMQQSERECYDFILKKVKEGRQAYIVYPLVNESDKLELKSVIVMAEKLQKSVFSRVRVGILHGQMNSADKEKVMKSFIEHEIDIMFTTIIIEVGIDVANASIMVIEHSERFGLANLHQLRGRVGRGAEQSYCILLGKHFSEESKRRLEIMLITNDGFKIAEEDLRLRGSGELFGTEQHGMPEFRIGNIVTDYPVLNEARRAAFNLIRKDPGFLLEENMRIRKIFTEKYSKVYVLGNVG